MVTTAVQANGGVVDKFVGDAVMAVWGVPEQGTNDALSAVKSAIHIRREILALNAKRESQGEFPIEIGIGIHSGATIFGAMGNGVRVDHTVIGPTINIASRIEGMAKEFDCDIIISHGLLESVSSQVLVEDLGMVNIRGMTSQVGIAKLLGVQVSESEFLIGHQKLEKELSIHRPGRVVGAPKFVTLRNYSRGPAAADKQSVA